MSAPLRVTALAASAQLGGTERVLLDFADRAFEHEIALRVLTPRDGPLIGILNHNGVPAEVVPAPEAMLRGSQQPGRLWSAIPAALALPIWARALRSHPFSRGADVLYSIGFKTHLVTTLPFGKRVVWHLHEFPPQTTGFVWKALARQLPNALIANSRAVGEAWRTGKREKGKEKSTTESRRTLPVSPFPFPGIHVVPNGVDLDRFKPRERTGWIHRALGLPPGARLVGMPAVFARWKGQELVVQAFRSIAMGLPNTYLVLVGGSIYDTVAERRFANTVSEISGVRSAVGGARVVQVLPFQPKIELVYPEFDLTVHYSLRPEPFGRVILESMACGVPVIAAAEGGPLEILGGSDSLPPSPFPHPRAEGGWLVEPRQVESLAGALSKALSLSEQERSAIGRLGRVRAEDHFSSRAFARGVAGVLKAVSSKQ